MIMDYLKVEGDNDFFRDPKTNSIINVNMTEYEQYITRRRMKSKETEKINDLQSEVSDLKDDLNEIKNLLRRLVNDNES